MSQTDLSEKPKALMCWSGGKDSAFALYKARQNYEVIALLTTLNAEFKPISMHGIREDLLDQQAAALHLPLIKVWVQEGTNVEYEQRMQQVLEESKAQGISHVIFGDIFLEDLRAYREKNLATVDLKAIFPLWQQNTQRLVDEFIEAGFQTITCCISDGYLQEVHTGQVIDQNFIKSLPPHVDPCGENGEYHTFCFDGPIFHHAIPFTKGEIIYRPLQLGITADIDKDEGAYQCHSPVKTQGFWFIDLLPLTT